VEAKPNSGWCWRRQRPLTSVVWVTAMLAVISARAQLAITEVMSSAATNRGSIWVSPKSDFWELTNFGTNTIPLGGYKFTDRDRRNWVSDVFTNRFIAPGESIVFVQTNETTIVSPPDFIAWWGASNLPPSLQVRLYSRPGFDSDGDAVELVDGNGNLVDRVDFGLGFRGHSFVFDPDTGEFGRFSALDDGSFMAVQADDVGSPGVTTGPVDLAIWEQPASLTEDAGADAEFSVQAVGLPRPTYQWFHKGVAIPGATNPKLVVAEIQPQHGGAYMVWVSNGVDSLASISATLVVNTNPLPPTIILPPVDTIVFDGQTAIFTVKARGYPTPAFQWQTNGVNIPGATNRTLVIPYASLAMSGTLYTVRAHNTNGSATASARLIVTQPPNLAITEVMASVLNGAASGHSDWFELTNLDTNAVSLLGYRFSDREDSFDFSCTLTNAVIIEPGESVIFVQRLTPEEFIHWWGQERLPAGLKIITYRGFGLDSQGEEIYFWNAAETDWHSWFTVGAFAGSTEGFSLRFSPPDTFDVGPSELGFYGAFRAVNGGDVGSPGYTTNPAPRILSASRNGAEILLKCRVTEGKQYTLRSKPNLEDPYWAPTGDYIADDFVITISQPIEGVAQRFFLLEEVQ
jgi:hypothetical protein